MNNLGIGARLKMFIHSKNLKKGTLAKMMGKSPGYISDIVEGVKLPGSKFLSSLKSTFPDLDLNWLVSERDCAGDTDSAMDDIAEITALLKQYPQIQYQVLSALKGYDRFQKSMNDISKSK